MIGIPNIGMLSVTPKTYHFLNEYHTSFLTVQHLVYRKKVITEFMDYKIANLLSVSRRPVTKCTNIKFSQQ